MSAAPWQKKRPPAEGKAKVKLSEDSIAWARTRAREAGRRYPNLVDNMAATRRQIELEASKNPELNRP